MLLFFWGLFYFVKGFIYDFESVFVSAVFVFVVDGTSPLVVPVKRMWYLLIFSP